MLSFNKVCLLFFLVRAVLGIELRKDVFHAFFGVETQPFGRAYVFDEYIKARIQFRMDMEKFEAPELLNCDKYHTSKIQEPVGTRRKREVSDSEFKLHPHEVCAYDYDVDGREARLQSEIEEGRFRELVKNKQINRIFCSNGFSENCRIRSYHSPQFTIDYYKKWNGEKRVYELETTYEIFSPPRDYLGESKEIMYREEDILSEFVRNKTLTANYECLGSPYTNVTKSFERDEVVQFLMDNYDRIRSTNSLSGKYKSVLSEVDPTSKRNLTKNRKYLKKSYESDVSESKQEEYNGIIDKLNAQIYQLNHQETEMQLLITKLDTRKYAFENQTNAMNDQCIKWMKIRFNLIGICLEAKKNLSQEIPFCSNLDTDMTNDLRLTCTNSALSTLRTNAILSVDRLRIDELQFKILNLFGIKLSNHGEDYKLHSKITGESKSHYVYSIMMSDVITFEQLQMKLELEINSLRNRLNHVNYNLRVKGDEMDVISSIIDKVTANLAEQAEKLHNTTAVHRKAVEESQKLKIAGEDQLRADIADLVNLSKLSTSALTKKTSLVRPPSGFSNKGTEIVKQLIILNETIKYTTGIIEQQQDNIHELQTNLTILQKEWNAANENYQSLRKEFGKGHDDLRASESESTEVKLKLAEKYEELKLQLQAEYDQKVVDLKDLYEKTCEQQKANLTGICENLMFDKSVEFNRTLNDKELSWNSTIENLKRAKRQVELENLELKKTKNSSEILESEFISKLQALNQDFYDFKNAYEEADRNRRSLFEEIDVDLKKVCKAVNNNLANVIRDLQNEDEVLSKAENSKAKRGVQFAAGSLLNFIWNGWNSKSILDSDRQFEIVINKQYDEYLKFAQLQSTFNTDMRTITLGNEVSLKKLMEAQKQNVETFKGLDKALSKLQDFSLANRLTLSFYIDVTNIQRLLMSLIQNNNVKTRVLESFALLRQGILPKDFISSEALVNVLNESKKYLNGRKLAFESNNLLPYYNLPLANPSFENGKIYIELRIPVVNSNRNNFEFDMLSVKPHPITCWNSSFCNEKKNHLLALSDNVALINQNEMRATLKKTDLECFLAFSNKQCWIKSNEEALYKDTCIEAILMNNQTKALHSCTFKETERAVSPIRSGGETFSFISEKNEVSIIRKSAGLSKEDRKESESFSAKLLIQTLERVPKNLFKSFDYETPKAVSEAFSRLEAMGEQLEKQKKFYESRTVENFLEEAKAEVAKQDHKLWQVVGMLLNIMPYTIILTILVSTGNWLFIISSIIVQTPTVRADMLTEAMEKAGNFAMENVIKQALKMLMESIYFITSILLAVIVLIALMLIAYKTVFQSTIVRHVYGTMRGIRAEAGFTHSWYLVMTTMVEENKVLYCNKHIVTIMKELTYDIAYEISTKDFCVILVEIDGVITMSTPISINFPTAEQVITDTERLNFDRQRVQWSGCTPPDLKFLNGQVATVSLKRLCNPVHRYED